MHELHRWFQRELLEEKDEDGDDADVDDVSLIVISFAHPWQNAVRESVKYLSTRWFIHEIRTALENLYNMRNFSFR